jgi:hypothetical protein
MDSTNARGRFRQSGELFLAAPLQSQIALDLSTPTILIRPLKKEERPMLYAILCYDSEDVVGSWTKEEDDAVLAKLAVVQEKLAREGKLGPVARLMPTTTATTLRKGREAVILDGPFAETKEALLGFFIVDCQSLDDAIDAARELGKASSSNGSYEIRPLSLFYPGAHPGAGGKT